MKCVILALLLCTASGSITEGHPIERVIKLVEGLKSKAIGEGKSEAVAFEKFQYWCTTNTDELKDAIADEKEKIEELTDKLAGLNKDKKSLEEDISTLEDELKDLQASAKKAKDDRKDEAALYSQADKDLKATIKSVGDCIKALEGAESKTESMLLAQKKVKAVLSLISLKATDQQVSALQSFADRPKQLAKGDAGAHVDKYDFKSENVIELLKQLMLKFEDDKLAGTKAETNALNAYRLAKRARDNAITAATKAKNQKNRALSKTKSDIADAEKEKKNTESDLNADSKTLDQTEKDCRVKTSEWETRSETRKNEIEAMDQAMKILAKATGVRTEAPGNPVPPPSPVKFLQLSQSTDPKMKAVALLKEAATDTHSRALERLAVEVAAHLNGPFDQVNNMIEKMIFRLMDEQKQEDEHKLWCDQEISKTNAMKSDKNDKIADLKAEVKLETGKVGKLTTEIADATKMISDIETFVKEATEIRNTGKKENALAIKDSQTAQTALTNAIAVLTDFYKSSGKVAKEPWEFIQKPVNLGKKPATWGSSYTGTADPKNQPNGIISVLEGVLGDFSKMEAETKSQEAQDQEEYDKSMSTHDIEKAERQQELKMKTAEKARRSDKIAELSSTQKDTEGELEKTQQYIDDLQKACVDGDSSYTDRKAARSKEITALKKAQVTLQDAFKAKMFLQVRSHSQ